MSIVAFYQLYTKTHYQKLSKTAFVFDTVASISIYDEDISMSIKEELINNAFSICNDLDNKFSKTKETSEIYKYNNFRTDLSEETKYLLSQADYFTNISDGLFNLGIERLTTLWDVKNRKTLPTKNEIKDAQNLIGSSFDFGAIVKGYACDKIKEYLISQSVQSAIINLGGNVLCIGSRDIFSGYNVGIAKPFDDNEIIKVLNVKNKSVVTSGIYQRYFKINDDDKIYSHIINPKTGFPVDNNLYSVTIVSDSSLLGDMLSTTILLMNPSYEDLHSLVKKINEDFLEDINIITINNKFEISEICNKYID